MNKQDLKKGMKVKTRNGEEWGVFVIEQLNRATVLINFKTSECIPLHSKWNDDLTHISNTELDIVEINK